MKEKKNRLIVRSFFTLVLSKQPGFLNFVSFLRKKISDVFFLKI